MYVHYLLQKNLKYITEWFVQTSSGIIYSCSEHFDFAIVSHHLCINKYAVLETYFANMIIQQRTDWHKPCNSNVHKNV